MILLPLFYLLSLYSFNPPQTTSGDITLSIRDIEGFIELEKEIPITVTINNNGSESLNGKLNLGVIDNWSIIGDSVKDFSIPSKSAEDFQFVCIIGKGTYAAHYPIHATALINTPSGEEKVHTVMVVEITQDAIIKSMSKDIEQPVLKLKSPGRVNLVSLKDAQVSFRVGDDGDIVTQTIGWSGTDQATGATAHYADMDRGDRRASIGVHPPWRKGWGTLWMDYMIQLPETKPIILDFATAIRDNVPDREPPSDGVQFQVWVGDPEFKMLFDRFSDSKRWEEARVDLTDYAGKTIRLRLLTHPGPKNDTTCDQAYWADPVILAGIEPYDTIIDTSRGKAQEISWQMDNDIMASIIPGKFGIVDGILSFSTPDSKITYSGFNIKIDGRNLGYWRSGFDYGMIEFRDNTWSIPVKDGDQEFKVVIKTWKESKGLFFKFSLEDVEKDIRGNPRFTYIGLGKVDQKVRRFYAGHGNVLENPGKFRIGYDGFNLSTSFIGFDFANGISMLQATDIPPDGASVDPERDIATLEAHHDLIFAIVASTKGAFDAARIYREIINPPQGRGVQELMGRMCLDQWGGSYARAAEGLEDGARYGMNHSVFVKHVWQRWGYDYRLPDIYPPEGNWDDFQRMVKACKDNGILFAPHDNYIDFYPDATGFSYKHIIFNSDGTPQRAWYNEGRKAQSYRWLPHAFQPWMENNLQMIKDGIGPTSYFIDVFSAITPMDYYDNSGRFYPKTVSVKSWGDAFDRVFDVFGNAPTISEAGHDALIGHLDGAEADHLGWTPESRSWAWNMPAQDGERIPWHDMVTHGRFIMLAGGLGSRYAGQGSRELHGYASDDYLSMTVLGGRNPMCEGPFNRSAVMTYWLLHDICNDLARQEMIEHSFADDNIHRQIVQFENSHVFVNRGKDDWNVKGYLLPQYGFLAESSQNRAMIIRQDGVITALAESPEALFVDARPPEHSGGIPLKVEILGAEMLDGRRFAINSLWIVESPLRLSGNTFIHFTNPEVASEGENIAFQSVFPIGSEQWQNPGIYNIKAEAELPGNLPLGEYAIRFGIYQPERMGRRFTIPGLRDNTGRRVGGSIIFSSRSDGSIGLEYKPSPPDEYTQRLNMNRKVINFGVVQTNGAFRLLKDEMLLIPLPESRAFDVSLKLDSLRLPDNVICIEALDKNLEKIGEEDFKLDRGWINFTVRQDVFAYKFVSGQHPE